MRGAFSDQGGLFSYISPEARVPANHPLRKMRELVRDVLSELNRSLGKLYASEGRPSIPPEQLLSALLLQVFYGIRSERQLMEQLDYGSLCIVGSWGFRLMTHLGPDHLHQEPRPVAEWRGGCQVHEQAPAPSAGQAADPGRPFFHRWDADRSLGLTEELPPQGTAAVMMTTGPTSSDNSAKMTRLRARPVPIARFCRKAAARGSISAIWATPQHGLALAGMVTLADGTAERRSSEIMLKAKKAKAAGRRVAAGEDKAYDTADHVANLRAINVTPHVTQNQAVTKTGKTRDGAIDERTTRHPEYGMSRSSRAMTKCIFGWGKQHGTMRKTKNAASLGSLPTSCSI